MINIEHEQMIPLQEAAKYFPGRPHKSTVYRFTMRGVRGVTLETVLVGGRRFTSKEAIGRFIANTTAAGNQSSDQNLKVVDANDLSSERVERGLDDAGII